MKLKLLCRVFANALLITIVLTFGISFKTSAQAPYNPMASVDSQLRELFSPLCHPTPEPLFLHDMSVHLMDSIIYTDNCPDTIYRDIWYKIYEELRTSAYDTTVTLPVDSIYTLGAGFYGDTVVMNVLAYDYLRFNDSALSCNYYFTADTVNNILIENGAPCELNPYVTQRVFSVSPILYHLKWANVIYRIDPDFIFQDNANDFAAKNRTLQIDFGDGSGWHTFPTNTVTHQSITYTTAGKGYIRARVYEFGNPTPIMSSVCEVITNDIPRPAPSQKILIDDATVDIWNPCLESGGPLKKTIIYIEGIDHGDALAIDDRDGAYMYQTMIKAMHVNDLRNFGYQIATINWKNSRRDIKDNAHTLQEVIKYFKCEQATSGDTGTHQQFVIIAESMGGLVARYAMCDWEQNWSTIGGCLPEKMHNTRLLITWDSPHQGANMPIAVQHFYRNTSRFLFGANTITQWLAGKITKSLLDATAVKQMLVYHVDTYNPTTKEYSEHSKRTDFKDDLNDLGNYPQYAKLVAYSNGSLKGIGQTHYYDTIQRTPNDYLLDLNSNQWIRAFGNTIQLLGTNLELRTTPNGSGPINANTIDFYKPKIFIRIKLGKLTVRLSSSYWFSIGGTIHGENVKPYDVAPGSVEDYNNWLISDYYQPSNQAFALLFGFNHPTYNSTSHTWSVNTLIGGGKFALGRDVTLTTDGMHWCFMPTISALDYNTNDLYENIEDENISTKTAATPFDLIVGIPHEYWRFTGPDTLAHNSSAQQEIAFNIRRYQRYHTSKRTDGLGTWFNGVASTNNFRYDSCGTTVGGIKYWLNREIGDDSLLVENRETAWTCLYDAEKYIGVNERSDYYQYPCCSTSSNIIPGMYSKEDNLVIGAGTYVIFMTRDTNEISVPSPLYDGVHVKDTIPWVRCCGTLGDGINNKNTSGLIAQKGFEKNESEPSYFMVYPNPVTNNEISIVFNATPDKESVITIYDLTGKKVMEKKYVESVNGRVSYKLKTEKGMFPGGVYLIKVKNGVNNYHSKVIIP